MSYVAKVNFDNLCPSRNLFILSSCQTYRYKIVHISLLSFNIYKIHSDWCLSLLQLEISVFSFVPNQYGKMFTNFIDLLKEPVFNFAAFLYCFVFYKLISALIFILPFLLLVSDSICFFQFIKIKVEVTTSTILK